MTVDRSLPGDASAISSETTSLVRPSRHSRSCRRTSSTRRRRAASRLHRPRSGSTRHWIAMCWPTTPSPPSQRSWERSGPRVVYREGADSCPATHLVYSGAASCRSPSWLALRLLLNCNQVIADAQDGGQRARSGASPELPDGLGQTGCTAGTRLRINRLGV